MVDRVKATEEAVALINKLKQMHGDLMFHLSGDCCDGSSPVCYPRGEFRIGVSDILLGKIDDSPFYISRDQYDYWKHTQLIIDADEGVGDLFSLESLEGMRFLIRSRAFTAKEQLSIRDEVTN